MDEPVIDGLVQRLDQINEAVREDFQPLDHAELNWKPNAESWSIAQCLEHVIRSNEPYFDKFEGAVKGTLRANLYERIPVLPGLWGRFVLNAVSPETRRKLRAPKLSTPSQSTLPADIVERFLSENRKLASAIQSLNNVDLDRIIITSPLASFVVYSLRHAVLILVAHEERHLLQAQSVRVALLEARRDA